jgi:hypothetical protein
MGTQKPESIPEICGSTQAVRLIDAFMKEIDAQGGQYYRTIDIKLCPSVQTILELPRDKQVPVVLEAVALVMESMRQLGSTATLSMTHWQGLKELVSVLLRRNLPYQVEDIDRLVQLVSGGRGYYSWQLSLGGILRAVENFCHENGIPECLRPRLVALRDHLQARSSHAEARKAVERLNELLTPVPEAAPDSLLTTDEAWTGYLRGRSTDSKRQARPRGTRCCFTARPPSSPSRPANGFSKPTLLSRRLAPRRSPPS